MKYPRFILGMLTGISLSALLGLGFYHFIFFPIPSGIYESPTYPFYTTEDSPGYETYLELQDPEYWRLLSQTAQDQANDYCRRNNISNEISVHCIGRPQGYTIYYSLGQSMSLSVLNNSDEILSVIVSHVDSRYHSTLDKIFSRSREKAKAIEATDRTQLKLEGDEKPPLQGEERLR